MSFTLLWFWTGSINIDILIFTMWFQRVMLSQWTEFYRSCAMDANFYHKWIVRDVPIYEWPSCSPDLNPLDLLFIWGCLLKIKYMQLIVSEIISREELFQRIEDSISNSPTSYSKQLEWFGLLSVALSVVNVFELKDHIFTNNFLVLGSGYKIKKKL